MSARLLWIIAAVIAVVGIITLFSGSIIWGIVLLIVAALVRPGGCGWSRDVEPISRVRAERRWKML